MRVIRNGRFWLVLGPSLALIGLAFVLPEQVSILTGGAVGWMVFALVILRSRERMEYHAAIRHLRRGEYQQAITIMDLLINTEPDSINHRQFRAQLYRLSGDLQGAAADYEWMIEHDPGLITGYLGLAELEMQEGHHDRAREYALTALERDTKSWMSLCDLGLIEDRRGDAEAAIQHLEAALASGIPHSRYRLLARLWLARNTHRLGRDDDAMKQIALMRSEDLGLRDWGLIFESELWAILRNLLEDDVQLAQELAHDLLKSEGILEALK